MKVNKISLFLSLAFLQLFLSQITFTRKYSKKIENSDFNLGESQTLYTSGHFTQILDHFNYDALGEASLPWNMRYLYNNTYWGGADNLSPILFYCGNEGDITAFWNNSGYVVDILSQNLNAYILFAEHRFFGTSMPFGADSYQNENLVYLTTSQAMADYVNFLRYYKVNVLHCEDCPVIAVGGSYGGMLAAWMRMKYPNIIDMALSASGPILQFDGIAPVDNFWKTASSDFFNATSAPQCGELIRKGFDILMSYVSDGTGNEYQTLNQVLNLCSPLASNNDINNLINWLSNAYFGMAAQDYPYAANLFAPLPGWCVNYSCQAFIGLDNNTSNEDLFNAMMRSSNIYYDYMNTSSCYNLSSDDSDDVAGNGWNVLECGEMSSVYGNNGTASDDIFPPNPWDYDAFTASCKESYNLEPDYDWVPNTFGGWNYQEDFQYYSRIIFSNGLLDPYHGGGVLQNISDSLIAIVMNNSAHHLDLRRPTEYDPIEVVNGRAVEEAYLKQWVKELQEDARYRKDLKLIQ